MTASRIEPKQWMRLGGLAGVVFVIATVVSIAVAPNLPVLNSSITKITTYFTSHRHTLVVGQIVGALAFPFVLWWLGTLRHSLGQGGEGRDPLGWIAVVSGITAATLGLAATLGTVLLAMLAGQSRGLANASVVRAVFDLTSVIGGLALIVFAAFVPSLGIAAVRRGMVGPWLGWFAVLDGVIAAISGSAALAVGSGSAWTIMFYVGFIGFGIFVLILSVQMVRGQGVVAATE